SHEARRISRLVGRYCEVACRQGAIADPFEEAPLLQHVGVNHVEQRVDVLLGTDVLYGGEIEDQLERGIALYIRERRPGAEVERQKRELRSEIFQVTTAN